MALCSEAYNNKLGVLSDQRWLMDGGGGACTTESKVFLQGNIFMDYGLSISPNVCRINSLIASSAKFSISAMIYSMVYNDTANSWYLFM